MTRPLTQLASRLRKVSHSGVEAEAGPPVQSLAQPAKEAKRPFWSFLADSKRTTEPSPPRRAKVPAFSTPRPQPSWSPFLRQGPPSLAGLLKVLKVVT